MLVSHDIIESLYRFADIIDKELIVRRYPNKDNYFLAEFDGSNIKNDNQDIMLRGIFGRGKNPESALVDYAKSIEGKIIIFDNRNENRQEFVVRF